MNCPTDMSEKSRKNDGAGKFWVKWFDPRALTVLGVMLIALCCVAAAIALWANNAAQPIAITRPAPGAALDIGKLGDSEGTSAPGAQVKLYDGSLLLGEARADSSGRWNFPLPTTLGAGGHTLRADALDAANRLTSATVAWTLVDPSAVARATETRPAPPPTSVPPTTLPATPAPPALLAPSFGVLPGVFPPANPLKEAPAGVKGAAYEAVSELTGTAGPNARVRLFDGDKVIGETNADAKGNWSVKIATPFALGPHSITAAAVDGAAVGPRSAAQAFTLVPAQIAVVVPTTPPEPTKAITPTRVVTAGVAIPAATVAPTKAPESTVTTPATSTPTRAAPTAALAATVAATKVPEATRAAPTAAPTAAIAATKAPDATKAAPTVAPTATVAATKALEATKAAPTVAPTATAIATKAPAIAVTSTAAPTKPAEATKVVAQAATTAPTKAPVLTPTPRVLLGVTGEQPESGSSLPIVIGAAAVLALAALALARRRIR